MVAAIALTVALGLSVSGAQMTTQSAVADGSTWGDPSDPGEEPADLGGPVDGLPPQLRRVNMFGLETGGQWTQVLTNTTSEVKASKQWFQLPTAYFMIDAAAVVTEDPNLDGVVAISFSNVLYVRSPKSAPRKFGYWPDVKVRSVAFGTIPVEATVRISMLRDENDLPIGWEFPFIEEMDLDAPGYPGAGTQRIRYQGKFITPYPMFTATEVTGKVNVQILDIKVDGTPVDVGNDCHIAQPADVVLPLPRMYSRWKPNQKPAGVYGPVLGGAMSGDIDIPEFAGCGAGGDDLDPLLTSLISGSGNGVHATQGELKKCGWVSPTPEGCAPSEIPMPTPEDPDPFLYPPDIGE